MTQANAACEIVVRRQEPLEGMSLNSLSWRVSVPGIAKDVQHVVESGNTLERVLDGDKERRYRLHLMPYRSPDKPATGAVLLFEDITRATSAEMALRHSEERYRQVTESLPQLVWTCTADGKCDYLSPQWVHYTGKDAVAQLGFGWMDQIHPDDRQPTIDHWLATANQGQEFKIEFRIRRHDGQYRWFKTLALPLRDEEGVIVKWFGSNTDIDDSKQTAKELESALQTLQLATQAANMGIWVWDIGSNTLIWDKRMFDIYGVPPQ